MKRRIYLITNLMLMWCITFAQTTQDVPCKQISPLTPNAASLGKFGDIPVSLYTGIPSIQIPLYDIVVKDFHLPISLSYHAGGIKVEDIPSWVGMGWSLNAGGLISRQQRGIWDEKMIDEYQARAATIQTILSGSSTQSQKDAAASTLYSSNTDNSYDTESDILSLNAGNLSQKFYLDVQGVAKCLPAGKLIIQFEDKVYYPNFRSYIARWKVTDLKGIQYIFGKTLDGLSTDIEAYENLVVCGSSGDNKTTVSSWYLNEIILPSGESIKFEYETYSFCIDNEIQETLIFNVLDYQLSRSVIHYTQALRLKNIVFPNGKVEFLPGDLRRDIDGDKVLDQIKISSFDSGTYNLQKTFKLTTNNPIGNTNTGDNSFRLALLSVTEYDKNGKQLSPYTFEYHNQNISNFGLPSRDSKNQDLWGYYNGCTTNTSLIPKYIFRDISGNYLAAIKGADRSIKAENAKSGILTKITYPTGGYSEFQYESNIARGITEIGNPESVNPIMLLANMGALPNSAKTINIQLENTNGFDEKYSDEFTIFSPEGVDVNVTAHILYSNYSNQCPITSPQGGINGSFYDCLPISFQEKNSSGNWVDYMATVYFGRSFAFFPNKTYRVKLKWNNSSQIGSWGYVDLSWTDLNSSAPVINNYTELPVGGLRIQKISSYDPVSQKTKIKKYSYDFDMNDVQLHGTSGVIQNVPLLCYRKTSVYFPASIPTLCENCLNLTSYSNSPILQTNGGYVGYKKVTEDIGENGEGGRICNYFLTAEDSPDGNLTNSQNWPFPNVTNYDWRRGLLSKQIQYKNASGQFSAVTTVDNEYTFNSSSSDINHSSNINIKIIGVQGLYCVTTCNVTYSGIYRAYNTESESFFMNKSTTTDITPLGNIITEKTFSQSPKCLEISSSTLINSLNQQVSTVIQYSSDIYDGQLTGTDTRTWGIRNLINSGKHNLTAPVESYTIKTMPDGTKYIIGGTLTTYYQSQPLPEKIYSLEISAPTLFSQFSPCTIDANGNFTMNSKYKLQTNYDLYDANYNLQDQHNEADIHSSYIWGYNNAFPVVKANNASYLTLSSAVSTSLPSGYSTVENLLTATGSMTLPGQQILWKTFNTALRNKAVLSNAQITTYTYSPLTGMTSQTDPNGLTTYYEYDTFGRLKLIKDNDGKILKTYNYHYKD